eukprot:108518_1
MSNINIKPDTSKVPEYEQKDSQIECFGLTFRLYKHYLAPNIPQFVESSQWLKEHYTPSKDEIWIVSYPKCGTTLTQQICHEIMHCVHTNSVQSSNHAYYKDTSGMHGVSGWIESQRARGQDVFDQRLMDTKYTKRIWKTHASLNHFPSKQMPNKMIIIARNPKDCLTSYYHHVKNAKASNVYDFKKGFDEMFMIWCLGLVENNSFFEFYQKYWTFYQQHQSNKAKDGTCILWLYYEDFVDSDDAKREQIKKLIKFMNVEDLVHSKEDIDKILLNSSVQKMSKQYENYVVKDFVRKGKCGDWKNYFNETQSQLIDNLISVRFNNTDFKYYKDLKNKKEYLCLN